MAESFEVAFADGVATAPTYGRADDLARQLDGKIVRVTREPVRSTRMPAGDLPGWRQVLAEDFTRPVPVGGFAPVSGGYLGPAGAAGAAAYGPGRLSGNEMRVYPAGGGTGNKGWYDARQTLSVRDDVPGADGVLDIWCHWGAPAGQTQQRGMGAAVWFPAADGRWRKGPYYRAEYRARSVDFNQWSDTRYGVAALFIDDQTWPKGGELDYLEGDLGPANRVGGYHHHADPAFTSSNWTQEAFRGPEGVVLGDWHIYATEWMPGRVRYLCDGQVVHETTTKCPSGTMPFVIQCSSHGAEPDPSTEGHLQIDWVTLYAYAPSA